MEQITTHSRQAMKTHDADVIGRTVSAGQKGSSCWRAGRPRFWALTAVLLIFTGCASQTQLSLTEADMEAMQALRKIYWNCVAEDVEYAGVVYKKNGHDHTTPKRFNPHLSRTKKTRGYAGYYHCHGAESGPCWHDEEFSFEDMELAERRGGVGYLVTPSGEMKKFDPKGGLFGMCGKTSSLGNVNE